MARGRNSISQGALQVADLLVTSSNTYTSNAIRWFTGERASHAGIYVGDGMVVDATPDGVSVKPLASFLGAEAAEAIVLRHPGLNPIQALEVAEHALQNADRKAGYDYGGAMVAASDSLCGIMGSPSEFFCSELVADAFSRAKVALTGESAGCSTPGDILQSDFVDYLGHLVANQADQDDFAPAGNLGAGEFNNTAQHNADPFLNSHVLDGHQSPFLSDDVIDQAPTFDAAALDANLDIDFACRDDGADDFIEPPDAEDR